MILEFGQIRKIMWWTVDRTVWTNMAVSMGMKPKFIEDCKDKQTGDYKSMENWHMVKLLEFI